MFLSANGNKHINLSNVLSFVREEKNIDVKGYQYYSTLFNFTFLDGSRSSHYINEGELIDLIYPNQIIPAPTGQYFLDYWGRCSEGECGNCGNCQEYGKIMIIAWSVKPNNNSSDPKPILFGQNSDFEEVYSDISILMPDGTVISRGQNSNNYESIDEWLKEERKNESPNRKI